MDVDRVPAGWAIPGVDLPAVHGDAFLHADESVAARR